MSITTFLDSFKGFAHPVPPKADVPIEVPILRVDPGESATVYYETFHAAGSRETYYHWFTQDPIQTLPTKVGSRIYNVTGISSGESYFEMLELDTASYWCGKNDNDGFEMVNPDNVKEFYTFDLTPPFWHDDNHEAVLAPSITWRYNARQDAWVSDIPGYLTYGTKTSLKKALDRES